MNTEASLDYATSYQTEFPSGSRPTWAIILGGSSSSNYLILKTPISGVSKKKKMIYIPCQTGTYKQKLQYGDLMSTNLNDQQKLALTDNTKH